VLRNNRRYRRVGTGTVTGHAVADLADSVLAELLEDPDRPFRQPGSRLLKDSRSSTVVELDLLLGGRPERVIYKRFRVTSWKGPWLSLLRPAPAVRSWVLGHALRFRRLPTPRPLVVLHRRRHGLKQEGYLLTVKVPGAVQLDAHVRALAELPEPRRRAGLRELVEQVARLVSDLHDRRLSDRDLKASNVLVRPEPRPCPALGEPVNHWPLTAAPVWLIDLVGVQQHRRLSRRRKVQNLARLHASFVHNPAVSRTDKLRFLRVYLRWGLCGKEGWKQWWRQIDAATQAKIARNARHGRILG